MKQPAHLLVAILLLVSPLIIIGRLGKIVKLLQKQIEQPDGIASQRAQTSIARPPT